MQVFHQQEDEEMPNVHQQEDEEMPTTIEGLIFPQLLVEGIAQRCTYCLLKTGCSVKFTSLGQYAKHIL
jgi:hypothetical protein